MTMGVTKMDKKLVRFIIKELTVINEDGKIVLVQVASVHSDTHKDDFKEELQRRANLVLEGCSVQIQTGWKLDSNSIAREQQKVLNGGGISVTDEGTGRRVED